MEGDADIISHVVSNTQQGISANIAVSPP